MYLLFCFQIFKEATDTLEGDKEPTIHLVLPTIEKIRRFCHTDTQENQKDSDHISHLKSSVLQYLDVRLCLLILYPSCITLLFHSYGYGNHWLCCRRSSGLTSTTRWPFSSTPARRP